MARPWIKIYRKTKGERIDYKNDEVGALWLNVDDETGKRWLSGKLGARNSQRPQVEVVAYINEDQVDEKTGTAEPEGYPDDDIPF